MSDAPRWKRWLPFALIAFGLLLVGYAVLFRSNDEEKILATLTRLAEAVRIKEDDRNPVFRALRLNKEFGEIFAESVRVDVPEYRIGGNRKELAGAAAQAAVLYRTAAVAYGTVDVRISGSSAEAETDATVSGTGNDGREREDVRHVVFGLEKVDGEWRITSLQVARREAQE